MHLIVYTSQFSGDSSDIDLILNDISAVAKAKNFGYDITGLLFFHQDRFVQILEGPMESLEGLMKTIARDERHENVVRLIDEPIRERSYSAWNMDSFNLSKVDTVDIGELITITRVFKETVSTRTDLLTRFYKAMLASHELKNI